MGLKLNPAEFERIFKYFDKNGDGVITYHEFVSGIRGELSADIHALVSELVTKVGDAKGLIDLDGLIAQGDFSEQKEVKAGTRTAAEARAFLHSCFDFQC